MKRIIFPAIALLSSVFSFSQIRDTITLDFCYQQVQKNYPLVGQPGLLSRSSQLRIANLNKSYLPQVNINANASLQSEVTTLEITPPPPIPAISGPKLSKDWYKVTLDVNQVIFDGNVTPKQKSLENVTLQSDQKSVEVELYKLKDRVNQLYFSIFFLQQNEALLQATRKQMEARASEVKSAVTNGTMLASAEDALRVEILRVDQQLTENRIDREAAFSMLSELISVPVPPQTRLVLPEVNLAATLQFENKRLEYQLFDVQQERVTALKNMVIGKWNPKLSAFGQLGYGRPGLNMLSNDFTPWWIVGARFTWNVWNWNQNRNDRQILDIQGDILKTQKATFDKNLRITSDKDLSDILKLTELIRQDDEIVLLREKITRTASSQMDNGVVTSSEYISRLNEEIQAKISRQLHQIQLVKAKQNYLFTLGKL